jgi:hypothetical protein
LRNGGIREGNVFKLPDTLNNNPVDKNAWGGGLHGIIIWYHNKQESEEEKCEE